MREAWRGVVGAASWPVVVGGALGCAVAAWWGAGGGVASWWSAAGLLGPTMWALCWVWWLERALPFRVDWREDHGDTAQDAGWAVLSLVVTQGMWTLGALAGAALRGGAAWWPHEAPWALQVALYLLVTELLSYLAHRLLHRTRLWSWHALHHSAPRLYWLNVLRVHPLDAGFSALVAVLWAALLGASPTVIIFAGAVVTPHLLLQHSNVHTRTLWLAPLFATSEFHRWHHRPHPDDACNYGHVLGVYDWLFGT